MKTMKQYGFMLILAVGFLSLGWQSQAQQNGEQKKSRLKIICQGDSLVMDSMMLSFPIASFSDGFELLERFGDWVDSIGSLMEKRVLYQWDDSAGLSKFPGMHDQLILEHFGDSVQGRFRPGQPIMVPFSPGEEGSRRPIMRRVERHLMPLNVVEEVLLADLPVLRQGGLKNSQMLKPGFDGNIDVLVDGSKLQISMTPSGQPYKKLEIRLIDEQGAVVASEVVKDAKGAVSRSYSLEAGRWYYVSIASSKYFFSKKVKVNQL